MATKPLEEKQGVSAGEQQTEQENAKPKNTKATKDSEEMVEVPVADLKAILERQEAQAKEIERLTAAADLNRLANFDSKKEGTLIRVARLSTWPVNDENKIILGWKTIRNDVKIVNGVVQSDQITRLFLDEGEGKKMSEVDVEYRDFGLGTGRESAEIVEKSENTEGFKFFVLRLPSGRLIKIDQRFINQ